MATYHAWSETKAELEAQIRQQDESYAKLSKGFDAVATEACQLQDALGYPCETDNAQENAMERIRDLIAAKGELGDLKDFIRAEVLHEIYNQHGQNTNLIERLRNLVACDEQEATSE